MNALVLLIVALSVFAYGCGSDTPLTTEREPNEVSMVPTDAANPPGSPNRSRQQIMPIEQNFFDDCTGETVHVTGIMRLSMSSRSNGNSLKIALSSNFRQLSAIGLDSGHPYVFSSTERIKMIDVRKGSTESVSIRTRLRNRVTGQVTFFTAHIHITVTGNGRMGASFFRIAGGCTSHGKR